MGNSRIEQIIEDIYDFVESCKPVKFSSTKVVVPKDELYDLLDELKLRTPDEIKRYQKIISNRDSILADAEKKADAMMEEARLKTKDLINENDIVQQAVEQANRILAQAEEEVNHILQDANQDASQIRTGALAYAEEMLGEVEKIISHSYESMKRGCDNMMDALHENMEVLSSNRNEITSQLYGTPSQEAAAAEETQGEQKSQEDDYNFDESAFLKHIDS